MGLGMSQTFGMQQQPAFGQGGQGWNQQQHQQQQVRSL